MADVCTCCAEDDATKERSTPVLYLTKICVVLNTDMSAMVFNIPAYAQPIDARWSMRNVLVVFQMVRSDGASWLI